MIQVVTRQPVRGLLLNFAVDDVDAECRHLGGDTHLPVWAASVRDAASESDPCSTGSALGPGGLDRRLTLSVSG